MKCKPSYQSASGHSVWNIINYLTRMQMQILWCYEAEKKEVKITGTCCCRESDLGPLAWAASALTTELQPPDNHRSFSLSSSLIHNVSVFAFNMRHATCIFGALILCLFFTLIDWLKSTNTPYSHPVYTQPQLTSLNWSHSTSCSYRKWNSLLHIYKQTQPHLATATFPTGCHHTMSGEVPSLILSNSLA